MFSYNIFSVLCYATPSYVLWKILSLNEYKNLKDWDSIDLEYIIYGILDNVLGITNKSYCNWLPYITNGKCQKKDVVRIYHQISLYETSCIHYCCRYIFAAFFLLCCTSFLHLPIGT